jgi:hypothetical protein
MLKPYEQADIDRIMQHTRLLHEEAVSILTGRRVKLRKRINGLARTGTINGVHVRTDHITVGVDIDRLDGQPGVLADPHYCDLTQVEVL